MSTPNDGGPAFPVMYESQGMSLRDYFAAAALQGALADTRCNGPFEAYAKDAYLYADAMLAERVKTNGGAA